MNKILITLAVSMARPVTVLCQIGAFSAVDIESQPLAQGLL